MLTEERNVLMLMSLLKEHNIRKVIISPGTTNVSLVASLQLDSYFELYSAYDERSAAYMACGMAAESGEPVCLSCTQATASRNYFPGLTEAYYRKLPVLAITSTQHSGRIGNGFQQAIDRSVQPVDTVNLSVQVPVINTVDDEWHCNVLMNRALIALRENGGGPVHMNLFTTYSRVFNQKKLPAERVIKKITYYDIYRGRKPALNNTQKIVIFVGSHKKWSTRLTDAVNRFCDSHNAVVLCDQVSNYKGMYRINPSFIMLQKNYKSPARVCDVLIHIGDVTGAGLGIDSKEVWRIDPNGKVMDTFRKQTYIFDMEEDYFFEQYSDDKTGEKDYLKLWQSEVEKINAKIPDLPLSNAWLAQQTVSKIPENSLLYLGIYNSYRFWSFFDAKDSVLGYANTGGFGIDGGTSSLLGASLVNNNICFGVFGDLAFFYDLNSLTNRHVKNNIRIILVNNGLGTEFKNPDNRAYPFGDMANPYIAACGHNGNKSKDLIRHYSEDLGFEYLSASTKEEYLSQLDHFVDTSIEQKMVFEVFVNTEDDTKAYDMIMNIESDFKSATTNRIKDTIGFSNVNRVKKIMGKI